MNDDATHVRIEELLAHSAWVRRLAARLVADPATADDLVQETWLAAMRRPPRDDRPVRPWLARVIRNVARQFRRGERRRANRETAAASDATLPSPDELLERVETERLLADLVLGLDEPYRSTVILRYREGLTAEEVASRLGIPAGTVRSRLKVALDKLRARLDARHGGDREAWSALLIPLVAREPARVGVVAALGKGVLAMSVASKVVSTIAVVIALVVVATRWPRQQDPDASESRSPATPAIEVREKGSLVAPDGSSISPESFSAAKSATADGIDRDRDLHGRVVGPRGEPVAQATLEVRRPLGREYESLDLDLLHDQPIVATGATDERGEFRIPLAPGRPFDLRVAAADRDLAPETLTNRYAGEFVIVELHASATLCGRITRASDGAAASRSHVQLMHRNEGAPRFDAESDASGAYRFDGIAPGLYFLGVEPRTEAPPNWIAIDLRPGELVQRDVTVTDGFTVKGTVTDATTGQPIVGATVGMGWEIGKSTRTDACGAYVLRGFPTEATYDVDVRAPGYGRSEHVVHAKDGDTVVVDLALVAGRRAKGRVLDESGAPVSGAYVAAVASEQLGPAQQKIDWISATTGPSGAFDLRDLRTDVRHVLEVLKEDFGGVVYDFPPTEASESITDFGDLVLRAASDIGGHVVDETGQGIPNAHVVIIGWNEDRFRWSPPNEPFQFANPYVGVREGRTDDLGRFQFGDLTHGEYRLEAELVGGPGRATQTVKIGIHESRRDVTLVLPRGLAIEGRVTDAHGNVVPLVQVQLQKDVARPMRSTVAAAMTDVDGAFRFTGLETGRYALVAYRYPSGDVPSDQRVASITKTDIDAGTTGVVLVMPRAVPIEGIVLDASGQPATKVLITVFDADGTRGDQVVTGGDGRFHVEVAEGSKARLDARGPEKFDGSALGVRAWFGDADAIASDVAAGTRDVVLRLPPRH
ncbi:MAG: sigma-70 family RNA polymerase sigma factor [Planctomycetes bacterium]|nr:sigma-70 family RNA polymerase sigma factor [Planctomycetota bacterium]